jgi:hemerythrin-like domain-containing protein
MRVLPLNRSEITMGNEISKLREEHVNFRKLLDLLEAQLDLFHRGEPPDYQLMTDILDYMTHYPDVFHHPREDVIFSRLLERDSSGAQSVEELARQHRVIAESGARLHENMESVINGALMPRQMIEAPGLLYVTYYRAHMDKEENDLFVLAEKMLQIDDWKKINAETRSQPDPIFGNAIEERYRTVYRHIAQTIGNDRAN